MIRISIMAAILLSISCGGGRRGAETTGEPGVEHSAATPVFFPVADYLRSAISEVDSLPVALTKTHTAAGKTSSGYIGRPEFRKLAGEFLPGELTGPHFADNYRESSFIDNASGNATFFYSSKKESAALKRIDVVTEKTDTYDRVKSVYLEIHQPGELPAVKKLYWQPGSNFQIITQTSPDGDEPRTEIVKVVWDNRE